MLLGGMVGWLAARGGRSARPLVLRREDNTRLNLMKGSS
jgi:sigma-E factor negative regulatory protein RseC